MGDALCGPSNALQNFQKHAATDRTLQQDRLVLRHSSSQSFRSSPGPSAGALDPEFEAFQAGAPPQIVPEASHFHHQSLPQHPAHAAPQSSLPSWASDFQRLNIRSGPGLHQIAPSHQAQAHAGQSGASWHQDFLQQQSGPAPQAMQPSQMRSTFSPMMQGGYAPMYAMGNQIAEQPVATGKQRAEFSEDLFDDAAFQRAFDDARAQISLGDDVERELLNPDLAYDPVHDESIHDTVRYLQKQGMDAPADLKEYTLEELQRLGQGQREPEHREAERQPQVVDDDALAQTAGQLLQSVADNTTQKFQESNFLALMRKIRDKEVKVEGDQMVEVSLPSSPLSTTTVETPMSTDTSITVPDLEMPLEWGLVSSSMSRPGSDDGMDVSGLNPAFRFHRHDPDSVACKVIGCDGSAHCTYPPPT